MNCIGNQLSLFLQRIYSKNSPQNCDLLRSAPCARRTAFAESRYRCAHETGGGEKEKHDDRGDQEYSARG